jgi:membrane associated rhomboid family serine protease
MLIPIGHEETSVRRLPWVSFTILALCVLSWGLGLLQPANDEAVADQESKALRYYFEHPYLELDPEIQKFQYYQMRQGYDESKAPEPPDEERQTMEQAELDRLTAAVFEARDSHRFFRWGLVPTRIKAYAVISHQFMHADFLHLFFNMLFFYLVAPYIEDVWGRPIFTVFYLLGGAAAGLGFALKYPAIDEPLIGASGAVSAAMGAFLVRYWNTKITFLYTLGLRRWTGTFAAPAWLMLLLWGAREVFYAQGAWVIIPGAAGNVAHWAHVYGFVFGIAFALVVRQLKVEERWVDRAIEEQLTVFEDTVVDEALERARQGEGEQAFLDLQAELGRHPDNDGAVAALWSIALGLGRCPEVAPRVVPVLRAAVRAGELEVVRSYWTDLIRSVPEVAVEPAVAVRVVEMLASSGHLDEAAESVEWLAPRLGQDVPLPLLVRLARVASRLHLPEAQRLAERARQHPRLTPEVAAELDRLAADGWRPMMPNRRSAPRCSRSSRPPTRPRTLPRRRRWRSSPPSPVPSTGTGSPCAWTAAIVASA